MSIVQGLLEPAGLAGLAAGIVIASVPVIIGIISCERLRAGLKRKQQEFALTLRRNQLIVEASGEGVLELDRDGRVRYANPAAAKQLGYTVNELLGLDYRVLINGGEDTETTPDPVRRVRYTTDIARGVGALLQRKDGQFRPVEYKVVPVTEEGAATGTVVTFNDVSERVRLDTMLRDTQIVAKIGGWEWDFVNGKVHLTEAAFSLVDQTPRSSLTRQEVEALWHPDDRPMLLNAARSVRDSGRMTEIELRAINVRGRELWVRVIMKAERRKGNTVRLYGTAQDVTERVLAERQLRQTRDFYEFTLDSMPTLVRHFDRQGRVTYANKAALDVQKMSREQMLGMHLVDLVPPGERARAGERLERVLRGESLTFAHAHSFGEETREWQVQLVPDVAHGTEIRGLFAILHDVTELKRLESRLLQAQKMEAVGQLTGGIAHDFNNLLGVVLGNLQLLERSLADTPSLARKVRTAMRAAIRGADLTRRLLTFARRQILDTAVVDLNRKVRALIDLVQRTLGVSIEVRIVLAADLWHTRVDASQLENAILNLAINARDAMPQGGHLTVETRNVHSRELSNVLGLKDGEYVSISVSDTGCGIAPENLPRVFEPFYTTKEFGKGSGLGLAMVHGFAEQAGGAATIESEVGRGTKITMLLPRCAGEDTEVRDDTVVNRVLLGGSETILVVEDDPDLRETVVAELGQLGYKTLEAHNAETALAILSGTETVDLLFTDVMMPGGTLGPQLAQRARELRPSIDVLFTTGYAENSVLAVGTALPASEVIAKPYRSEDLAMRIRYLLDREARVA
jgi:PAS domain S-box-containing protein